MFGANLANRTVLIKVMITINGSESQLREVRIKFVTKLVVCCQIF